MIYHANHNWLPGGYLGVEMFFVISGFVLRHALDTVRSRITLLPGIIDAVDEGEIKISSLHNFCPLPMGVEHAAPNIFKAVAARTIDAMLAE